MAKLIEHVLRAEDLARTKKPFTRAERVGVLRPSKTVRWHLHDALLFVRRLERKLKVAGAHVALTGSVLQKGESKKDLDVVIFPRQSQRFDLDLVRGVLEELGMRCVVSVAEVHRDWRGRGIRDRKKVEIWVVGRGRNRKRVDVMFLK